MKKLIALLIFVQFGCFNTIQSQNKQAPDACPSFNKKQASTSKDYASLSTRSAAKDNSDFSKPRYQSIYTKNTANSSASSKKGKATVAAHKENVQRAAAPAVVPTTTPAVVPATTPVVIPVKEVKNKSSKSSREPEVKKGVEPTVEKATETKEAAEEEEFTKPVEKTQTTTEQTKGKAVSSKKDKTQMDLDKNKAKQKQQKALHLKKLKCGKKSATSCPEF